MKEIDLSFLEYHQKLKLVNFNNEKFICFSFYIRYQISNQIIKLSLKEEKNDSKEETDIDNSSDESILEKPSPKRFFNYSSSDQFSSDDEPSFKKLKDDKYSQISSSEEEFAVKINFDQEKLFDEVIKIVRTTSRVLKFPTKLNFNLCYSDAQTVLDERWLNDNVVDYYFELIINDDLKQYERIFYFSSLYFAKLVEAKSDGDFKLKKNLSNYDLVFMPIIIDNHWSLIVIYVNEKKIIYYDSLIHHSKNHNIYLKKVAKLLEVNYSFQNWNLKVELNLPQQENNFDCGVFSCQFAKSISRKIDASFNQSMIPLIRKKILYEMYNSKLI